MEFKYSKKDTDEHNISIKSCGKIPNVDFNVVSEDNWLEKELVESLQEQYDTFKKDYIAYIAEDTDAHIDIHICKINNSILHRVSMSFYEDSTEKNRYFRTDWDSVTQVCENVGWGHYYDDPIDSVLIEVINKDTDFKHNIYISGIKYAEID